MTKKELFQTIKNAAKEGITALDLSGKGLTKLPQEIGQLTKLKEIDLRDNKLTTLPPTIGQLINLTKLNLKYNQLAALPPEIGQLINLREFNLCHNSLSTLPQEIGQLTELTIFDVRDNKLVALPREIGLLTNLTTLKLGTDQTLIIGGVPHAYNKLTELPSEIGLLIKLTTLDVVCNMLIKLPEEICHLRSLKDLDLTRNELTTLPQQIGQLTNLTSLSLAHNNFIELPREIGLLTNLKSLHLYNNQLTSLPTAIGKLGKLEILLLHKNQLTVLSPEIGRLTRLTNLTLNDNRLPALPAEIRHLTQLQYLDLKRNTFPIPPEILDEILDKTYAPATIIDNYLQQQAGQKKLLNEAKVLLVGQGGVGKTSLVKRLVTNQFDRQENKTEGINITRWQILVKTQSIRLNVWDFGGQEIMHATHQFFLTKRSLYLLVLDARLGEEENRVEYWLKIIQSFGGDSPVIIVGNKIDQHPLDIDKSGLQNKYSNIKAVMEISCQTGRGLNELKDTVTKEVEALEHINDKLPDTWFNVKDRLENMKEDYITFPQYALLCYNEGVEDKTSPRTLLGFLHDLGTVLNFKDDPRLEDTNILNPEWVTNGVYKIINSNILFQNKGVIELSVLNGILDSEQYPKDKLLFIMDMMRKFELCFDFEGFTDQKFLIPDLLSKEEPYTGDWQGRWRFNIIIMSYRIVSFPALSYA